MIKFSFNLKIVKTAQKFIYTDGTNEVNYYSLQDAIKQLIKEFIKYYRNTGSLPENYAVLDPINDGIEYRIKDYKIVRIDSYKRIPEFEVTPLSKRIPPQNEKDFYDLEFNLNWMLEH